MTEREKLAKLSREGFMRCAWIDDDMPDMWDFADHLIANGVTFAPDIIVGGKTNADRIRAMSDEELAWELMTWRFDAYAKAKGDEATLPSSQKTIVDWLKQPVKDGEGDATL